MPQSVAMGAVSGQDYAVRKRQTVDGAHGAARRQSAARRVRELAGVRLLFQLAVFDGTQPRGPVPLGSDSHKPHSSTLSRTQLTPSPRTSINCQVGRMVSVSELPSAGAR